MDGFSFSTEVRIRFAETDAQGIAHHASFVVWLEVARVAYLAEHAGGSPAGNPLPEQFRTSRSHHFAFLVEDATATYARAQELGLKIVSPPKARPDGFVQVFLNDPDGHVVELCSPAR